MSAAPSLKKLLELQTKVNWMNGIQYYFVKDFPINPGHNAWLDSKVINK